MTVQRVHRDSDVFRVTCNTCGTHTNIRGDDQFEVGRTAARHGWTLAARDRCGKCPEPEVRKKHR